MHALLENTIHVWKNFSRSILLYRLRCLVHRQSTQLLPIHVDILQTLSFYNAIDSNIAFKSVSIVGFLDASAS